MVELLVVIAQGYCLSKKLVPFPKHKYIFKLKKKTEVVYISDVFRHKLSNCRNKERDPLITVRLGIK